MVLDILIEQRGDVEAAVYQPSGSIHPVSLLHLASKQGHLDVLGVLLARGARVGLIGQTALGTMRAASMPKEAIKAFSGAYETWELGSSTAAGLRPARRSNPGWLSRAAVGKVLTAVLGSLGFAVGEGADQYVDACFECCCSEQHQAAIWVDDVAQYAARVSASVNSCTPEQVRPCRQ